MIQQDTVWRRSIFEASDRLLHSDSNDSQPFDVIFDRLAHINAATLRSNWINGIVNGRYFLAPMTTAAVPTGT